MSHDQDEWLRVADEAAGRVAQRHERMLKEHGLTAAMRYDWSMDDATITWARDGEAFLSARVTVLGSVNPDLQTWLWSWANEGVPEAAKRDIERVRQFGEERHFPLLVWSSFQSDEEPVNQATMVALDVLGADGFWRDKSNGLEVVFAITDIHAADPATPTPPVEGFGISDL